MHAYVFFALRIPATDKLGLGLAVVRRIFPGRAERRVIMFDSDTDRQ